MSVPPRGGLSVRTAMLLVVALAFVPAAVVLLLAARDEHARALDEAARRAAQSGQMVADVQNQALASVRGLFLGLAGAPERIVPGAAGCPDILRRIRDQEPAVLNLMAVTPDGSVYCSAAALDRPVSLADRPYVKAAVRAGDFAYGDLLEERTSHRPALNVAYPVRDDGGATIAVLVGAIDLVALSGNLASALLPPGSAITILDERGIVVARQPDPEVWVGVDASGFALAQKARDLGTGTSREVGVDGVPRIYAFQPLGLDGTRRELLVGIPEAAVELDLARTWLLRYLALAGLAVVAAIAAVVVSDRAIVAPLARLRDGMGRLREGEAGARVSPEGTGEIGALTRTFNAMAADLERLTEQVRLVVACAPVGIVALDRDGRVTMANPAAAAILGREPAETLDGASLHAILHPPGSPDVHDDAACPLVLARPDDPTAGSELPVRRPDLSMVWVDWIATAIRRGGEQVGTSVFLRDVTRRVELEQELRQSHKMEEVGRLAGSVAHDFNNLLAVIVAGVDLVRRRMGEAAPTELGDAIEAAHQAAAITRQLLLFSRRQASETRVVDVDEAARGVLRLLHRLLGPDYRVTVTAEPGLPPVRIDPHQIEQVVLNLVVNARDAMPDGGDLTVETHAVEVGAAQGEPALRRGRYVSLSVSDTGSGMDEETRRHVFEPFFTTKTAGTGLGLAIVDRVVRAAGGACHVYSEPGVGTTFRVFLPASSGTAEHEAADAGPPPRAHAGESVLVVAYEDTLRRVIVHALEDLGYAVEHARDALAARRLANARSEPFSLLLTDVLLPRTRGPELAEQIRGLHPETRVLFLTSPADAMFLARPEALASTLRLLKPFTTGALARHVRDALDAPALAPA